MRVTLSINDATHKTLQAVTGKGKSYGFGAYLEAAVEANERRWRAALAQLGEWNREVIAEVVQATTFPYTGTEARDAFYRVAVARGLRSGSESLRPKTRRLYDHMSADHDAMGVLAEQVWKFQNAVVRAELGL